MRSYRYTCTVVSQRPIWLTNHETTTYLICLFSSTLVADLNRMSNVVPKMFINLRR